LMMPSVIITDLRQRLKKITKNKEE
jgi:hypothetical protein